MRLDFLISILILVITQSVRQINKSECHQKDYNTPNGGINICTKNLLAIHQLVVDSKPQMSRVKIPADQQMIKAVYQPTLQISRVH